MVRTEAELISIRDSVALVGRLSDSIVRLGPFSLGLDGVLSWVPGVGELYSIAAGGFILMQGARAGVSATVLVSAAVILAVRTFADVLPFVGPLFADLFTAHKWAARMIVEAIDKQLGSTSAKHQATGRRALLPFSIQAR